MAFQLPAVPPAEEDFRQVDLLGPKLGKGALELKMVGVTEKELHLFFGHLSQHEPKSQRGVLELEPV